MHFWSGSTVKPEEIADIPSYNRANGLMWAVYAACMLLAGVISLFSITVGAILLVILCVPGIVALILVYKKIYNKYKSQSVTYEAESEIKTSKVGTYISVLVTAIIFIVIGVLFYKSEKEPEVSISDNQVRIKALYGLTIDFSEITDIQLLEKSMKDIGIGRRTNGYGGSGGTLKGHFKSDNIGKTLLFVQADSSPTIKIERSGEKDIYISLRNSESTKQLYDYLIANIPIK